MCNARHVGADGGGGLCRGRARLARARGQDLVMYRGEMRVVCACGKSEACNAGENRELDDLAKVSTLCARGW